MTEKNSTTARTPSLAQLLKERIKGDPLLHEGDVIEARLLRKTLRMAFFDIGKFGAGIVYGHELLNAKELIKKLELEATIPAKVIALDGEGGYVELSLAEADEQRLWQQAKELQESGETIKVKILGANAGGLITTVSELKAFLPVSRLSNEHYPKIDQADRQKIAEELKKFIGQELDVKVIDVNPRSKKLIVSERETLAPNLKELLNQYAVQQVVEVIISGIADFGAFVKFVDNPQIEGLIHISELDHRLVTNPKERVHLNEIVKAKIIEIRDGRVFLSLKTLTEDPWLLVEERYRVGQETQGSIYKLNPFGAVVSLEGDLQGIIHVSEFGGVEEMKNALTPGELYNFIVDSIRPQERRLILKLKK